VEHDQQMIKEGKSVILTLKDKGWPVTYQLFENICDEN